MAAQKAEQKEFEVPILLPYAPEGDLKRGVRIVQRNFQLFKKIGSKEHGWIRLKWNQGAPTLEVLRWTVPIPLWVYHQIKTERQFMRIRFMNGVYTLTDKRRQTSDEWEIELPEDVALKLWELGATRELRKTRYYVTLHGKCLEVDCFDWGVWRAELESDELTVKRFRASEYMENAVKVLNHPIFGSSRAMLEYVKKHGAAALRREAAKVLLAA